MNKTPEEAAAELERILAVEQELRREREANAKAIADLKASIEAEKILGPRLDKIIKLGQDRSIDTRGGDALMNRFEE